MNNLENEEIARICLRDKIAMVALAELMKKHPSHWTGMDYANMSYQIADCMLLAKEQDKK